MVHSCAFSCELCVGEENINNFKARIFFGKAFVLVFSSGKMRMEPLSATPSTTRSFMRPEHATTAYLYLYRSGDKKKAPPESSSGVWCRYKSGRNFHRRVSFTFWPWPKTFFLSLSTHFLMYFSFFDSLSLSLTRNPVIEMVLVREFSLRRLIRSARSFALRVVFMALFAKRKIKLFIHRIGKSRQA